MSGGVVTCPGCRMRVLPGVDNRCPSCHGYDFSSGVAVPEVVAKEKLKRPEPTRLVRVAAMHWATTTSIVVVILVALVRFFVRMRGRYAIQEAGFDYDRIIQVNGVVGVIAVIALAASARSLGKSIGLDRWFNVFVLVKESVGYFREEGVAVGILGPSFSQISRMAQERDEGGRPTTRCS